MNPEKIDYTPLLSAGLHPHTLESFKELTVKPFPDSKRREPLWSNLSVYLDLLEATGLKARVWLDGSFVTEKIEPDDIDLVVVGDLQSFPLMSVEVRQQLKLLLDTGFAKSRFGLHVFFIREDREEDAAFWLGFFGYQRDEVTPKGLAELRVNHG